MPALLEVENLTKHFPLERSWFGGSPARVHAVDGISFAIQRGETLALVGESGCGKSTAAQAILRLIHPTSGTVRLDGQRIDTLSDSKLRPFRRRMQVIFQDPFSSLNPRMRVHDVIAEPLHNFHLVRDRSHLQERLRQLMSQVGLSHESLMRYPHEFSGGQRQRIGIARALAPSPDLIICDEAVSALDVSVKAQIVNLLAGLQAQLGLALLFVSHDLAVVERIAHRVAVMYLGRIVEIAESRALIATPHHPYTRALLSAVPVPDPEAKRQRIVLRGDVPSPINPPPGCRFHTRCPYAFNRCSVDTPTLRQIRPGQHAACHLGTQGAPPLPPLAMTVVPAHSEDQHRRAEALNGTGGLFA